MGELGNLFVCWSFLSFPVRKPRKSLYYSQCVQQGGPETEEQTGGQQCHPSSAVPCVCHGDFRLRSWDAGVSAVRSLESSAFFTVDLYCLYLSLLVHFSALLQAAHQEGLLVPPKRGITAKMLSLCWNFMLPWLC